MAVGEEAVIEWSSLSPGGNRRPGEKIRVAAGVGTKTQKRMILIAPPEMKLRLSCNKTAGHLSTVPLNLLPLNPELASIGRSNEPGCRHGSPWRPVAERSRGELRGGARAAARRKRCDGPLPATRGGGGTKMSA